MREQSRAGTLADSPLIDVQRVDVTRYARAAPEIDALVARLAPKTDLAPVTAAIVEAATAAEPAARYLVGESAAMFSTLAAEADRIHTLLRARHAY